MESRSVRAHHPRPRSLPLGPLVGAAAMLAALAAAYALGSRAGVSFPVQLMMLAVGLPVVVASGFFAARRPTSSVAAVLLLMAFAGTLATNEGIRVDRVVWALLVGLVVAMIAGYLNAARPHSIAIWPGVAALAAYLAFTALQIPFAETTEIGMRAFADGPALILAFFALAYSQWRPETRWRIAKAFVAVALVVGAYALFRLVVGPTDAEEAVVRSSGGVEGDLSLIGSFVSRHALGAWSAVALPFLFSLAVATRGRWRIASAAGLVLVLVALLGSELRTALLAAAAGVVVATALYAVARAFRGGAGVALIGIAGLATAGIVAFALTVGSSTASTERFERILSPGEDYSFQQRTKKWNLALADINQNPLGQGLGTAGATQREYSRTFRIGNRYIDSSYLQLGVEQGYPGWILFGFSVLSIGYVLARSSVGTLDRRQATVGIGATASLAAWLVMILTSGDQLTSWAALLLWILLGLGVGGFVTASARPPS